MGIFKSKPVEPTDSDIIMSRLTWQIIELCRPEWMEEKDEKLIEECAKRAEDLVLDAFMVDALKYYPTYAKTVYFKRAIGKQFIESGLTLHEYLKKDWMTSVW